VLSRKLPEAEVPEITFARCVEIGVVEVRDAHCLQKGTLGTVTSTEHSTVGRLGHYVGEEDGVQDLGEENIACLPMWGADGVPARNTLLHGTNSA